MEELLETRGELSAFRTYQKQPGIGSGRSTHSSAVFWNRKLEYGALIVNTLDLDRIPRSLAGVLAHLLPEESRRELP
jgi:hypothetical protein